MRTRPLTLRASALLLVLWALLLLSATVFAWVISIQNDITAHAQSSRVFEARTMAHSGLSLGLHPLVTRKTPVVDEEVAPGMGFKVRIVGEGGRLHLNWLLRGEEPRKVSMLKQWLERRGLDFQQRETFVDCLLDYIDGDDLKRLSGVENQGGYHPANRDLQSLDEVARIPGTAPLTSQAGWQDDLTIYSLGPIDLDSASVEVLTLLPGLGQTRIAQFVQFRQGPDGLDGTGDDSSFPNMSAIQQYLGLNPAQFKELSGLVSYKDSTLRVISEGYSGEVARQIVVVARKDAAKAHILSWKE